MLAIFFVLASVGVAGCIDVEKENDITTYTVYPSLLDIFVDSETFVMYLSYRGNGITVLLNSDGTPKLYDPQTYTGEVYFF